eukprot:RCo052619
MAFPVLQNDCIIRAARGEPVPRVPVWAMRQAGRYLPEYRAFTADKDFFAVCQNPEWACEVTVQPIDRMDLDAAIIFSDILVIPQAVGMDIRMVPSEGPVVRNPIRDLASWEAIVAKLYAAHFPSSTASMGDTASPGAEPSREAKVKALMGKADELVASLDYVCRAITLTRHRLGGRVPLIGFCGSPWTLFVYMAEGKSSRLYAEAKKWLYALPAAAHEVLSLLTEMCARFLIRQIQAGAQLTQVFDSHGGGLHRALYEEFNLPYLRRIAEQVKKAFPDVPAIVFSREANFAVGDLLRTTAYDVFSLATTASLGEACAEARGIGKAVQGNLDPGALYAPAEKLRQLTAEMLAEAAVASGTEPGAPPRGYIANLGHGMNPNHDPEQLKVFVEAVHSYRHSADHVKP